MRPLVSIVVANYNYARFVGQAIDSALQQSYPNIEVVVVDDGSTDGSRELLAGYGDRIQLVLQENAGHCAAVNAGGVVSQGEIVCLLDADDGFYPDKVGRVVKAFATHPRTCLVYHQFQTVSPEGTEPVGRPHPRGVWKGDIRARAERAGGWWPRPTTSGLAFSRSFLDAVLPMPTDTEDPFPDTYLAGAAPFFGPIFGIAEPLGWFRLHGSNTWSQGAVDRTAGPQLFAKRRDRYAREFVTLQETLRDRLELTPAISLDDHLRYQRYRRGAGERVSLASVVTQTLRCPTLPWSMRWREAVKVTLGRW